MSLSAGATSVAAICESIEHHGKEGRINEARAAMAMLRPQLDLVCAEMTTRLGRRKAG